MLIITIQNSIFLSWKPCDILVMRRVTHMNVSYHKHECITSHEQMCHVKDLDVSCRPMNDSCHTSEGVTSKIWVRCWCHITNMNVSRLTHKCVMSKMWMCDGNLWMILVTYPKELRQKYEKTRKFETQLLHHFFIGDNKSNHHQKYKSIVSLWMKHVININESWHTYWWVMSHIWISHVARI